MSYCLNPLCDKPKNPKNAVVCQNCGTKLQLQGRYQILGILGKGGFGATFAAIDLSPPRGSLCVIKQLRPMSDDPDVFQMAKKLFEREAQTLYKLLDHAQVPKILNYFEENHQFYLVQEYIKGYNLHQIVKKKGTFSETGVKQFLSEILPILEYIHSQQIVHRDIKPANIIRQSDTCQLVLIDFGAVKNAVNSVASDSLASSALTAFAVGTVGFAPPEQLAMRPVYASDIYALGITCIYLLTGKNPKQLQSDPTSGEILWQDQITVSEAFAQVLTRMLAASVKERYKSATEVLEALQMLPYEESMKQSLTALFKERQHYQPAEDRSVAGSSLKNLSGNPSQKRGDLGIAPPSKAGERVPALASGPLASPSGSLVNSFTSRQVVQPISLPAARKNTRQQRDKTSQPTANLKLSPKVLLTLYREGRRDFADQVLVKLNLPNTCLTGINFYQANLAQANLQKADLSGANLGRVCLNKAILKHANLRGAYLAFANLQGADLRGADLSEANLKYANLDGANLCGTNLAGCQVNEEQLSKAKTNWFTTMPKSKRGLW